MEVTENTQIPIENPILRKAMYKCYGAKCFYTGQLVEFEDMHIDP
ncbi:MAG TPA: hypothetical protein PK390_06495 [Fervidobacterium nodosum]|nr:hypothetical protein [Fervidobacterium nodosum]